MDLKTLILTSNQGLKTNNCRPWELNPESLEDVFMVVKYLESRGFTKKDISVIYRPEKVRNSGKMTTWVAVRVKSEDDFFLNARNKRVTGDCLNYVALGTLARRVKKGEKLSFGGRF